MKMFGSITKIALIQLLIFSLYVLQVSEAKGQDAYKLRRYMSYDKPGHYHIIQKSHKRVHNIPNNEIFVPPYVKKQHRRNKHLLSLLHGTVEERPVEKVEKLLKQNKNNVNLFENQRSKIYDEDSFGISHKNYNKNFIPGEKLKLSPAINNQINEALNAISKRKHNPDMNNYHYYSKHSHYSHSPRKIGTENKYSGTKRLRLPIFGIMQREKRLNQ